MTCNISGCNLPAHYIWRCEKHYSCDICGTKNGLVTRIGGVTCNSCHDKIAREKVAAFDGDTDCTDEITCPWCGYEQSDSWEACDEDKHICDYCGNKYSHVRDVTVTYGTEKIIRS